MRKKQHLYHEDLHARLRDPDYAAGYLEAVRAEGNDSHAFLIALRNVAEAKVVSQLAQVERMEDGEWYAYFPGCDGLWATGTTEDAARQELASVLDGWLLVNAPQRSTK